MTCVAIGLLLRVSYELDRAERQVARVREGAPGADAQDFADVPAAAAPAVEAVATPGRGPRRIEPRFGAVA